ncbi:hypothetical protein VPH35_131594 [Triticum aestivum]
MKELKATKIIQCDATYVNLGDLAESVRPTGKMSKNLVACGIDFINKHVDICPDKTIRQYIVTWKIWDGDFHHKILRKHFATHGDFKLTLKKYVMFPMFQELAPEDLDDKCGHHYAICLDLKNQCFEVQISHFPIEYVTTEKQENWHDCRFYMLEYLAKWEGRRVPVIAGAMVVELRKIYTWNWLMNEDFNRQASAQEFIEGAVKSTNKKYK